MTIEQLVWAGRFAAAGASTLLTCAIVEALAPAAESAPGIIPDTSRAALQLMIDGIRTDYQARGRERERYGTRACQAPGSGQTTF
jgi:hypothetical protein